MICVSDNPFRPDSCGAAALQYATELRWAVFPAKPKSKMPHGGLVPNGVLNATTDAVPIRRWWSASPDANVAIAAGLSNLLIVDCDRKNEADGVAVFTAWCEIHDIDLRDILCVKTPSGGRHYYWGAPSDVDLRPRVGVLPGVDVRAGNSYVVAPPSVDAEGNAWIWVLSPTDGLLSDAPNVLIELVGETARPVAPRPRKNMLDVIPDGERNANLTSLAGAMRRKGATTTEMLAALRERNKRCVPPLCEKQLERIANSVGRYDPERGNNFPRTDIGNAEFFADLCGDEVRYDHRRRRFLIWRGQYWKPDTDGAIIRLGKDAVRARNAIANSFEDDNEREAGGKWAVRSEDTRRLKAMTELARALPPVADDGSGWDPNPSLLGVPNGVIDLRTGEFRAGAPGDRITRVAGCDYEPRAEAPRWDRFLIEVFPDPDLREWIQIAVGYTLTGDTSEQCFFLCYGLGANGKSKFFNGLSRAFGDYAVNVPFSTFEATRSVAEAASPILASLDGPRFVTATEVSENSRLNEARLKELTGEGPITARRLYRDAFTFHPRLHLWLGVNHRPAVRDDSDAFWRRVRLIPFTQTFSGERVDPFLEQTLAAEAPGILRWAVEGAVRWYKARTDAAGKLVLGGVPNAEDLLMTWRRENDPVEEFLDDRTVMDPDAYIGRGDLYDAYGVWCDQDGVPRNDRLRRTAFSRRITPRHKTVKIAGKRCFKGLRLLAGTAVDS